MTKIKTYTTKDPVVGTDKWIGSDGVTGETKNFDAEGVADYVMAGLEPEVGGTLAINEITYTGVLTTPEDVVNDLDPNQVVQRYEVLVVSVNGDKYIFKLQNVTVGVTQTAVTADDFITLPTSVGPTGNGIASIALFSTVGLVKTYRITYTDATTFDFAVSDGAPGADTTSNNLQKIKTASWTLDETDNNHTVFIDNDVAAVNITVPAALSENFAVGFIQQGTGLVTFVASGTTVNNPVGLKLKGEGFATYLEKVGSTTVYYLTGDTKA